MRNEAYENGNKIGYAQTSAMLTGLSSLWTLCKTLKYRMVSSNAVVVEARIPLL